MGENRSKDSKDEYIKTLQAELQRKDAHMEALRQEFRQSINEAANWTPEDLKKQFNGLLEQAFNRLQYLLGNADSESVQLSAAKFVFQVGLGAIKITDANDPGKVLRDLLEGNESKDEESKDEDSDEKLDLNFPKH
jgi:hypothetical protein